MTSNFGTWSSKMPFPHLKDAIFIDIETDLAMEHVWLIGVKIDEVEEQYLAHNWDEEDRILIKLSKFLSEQPNKPLICYSTTNFDFRVLNNAARRLGTPELIEQMRNRALIDMATLLRRHYTPYGGSYSLKMLRFLIGYSYQDLSLNGEEVAIRYYQQVRRYGKITDSFADKALLYNRDDIRILHNIIKKFEHNISYTSSFTRDREIQDIKKIIHADLFSSKITDNYIRISVYNKRVSTIIHNLMSHGLPLPVVKEGVHTTALYWQSQFGYEQLINLISDLDLSH